jgi:hypothetical protein
MASSFFHNAKLKTWQAALWPPDIMEGGTTTVHAGILNQQRGSAAAGGRID